MTTLTATKAASAALARFAAEAAVPERVRLVTRRYLLDWLGSALAGGEQLAPTLLRGVVDGLGGASQATILASGTRTSAPLAALANAAAAHVLELDDLDRGSIAHPGAPVIAAALAVAERDGLDGDALLDAIAVGYEVCIRTGEALGPSHYEYWHTTGTAGTLGAAAAAARLHGLDASGTLCALGSAGTMAAGLWEFLADAAMSKQLHPAKAAHDGVLAALLAAAGFTSATRILEGPQGVLAAMSDAPDATRLTEGLDALDARGSTTAPWRIEGVSFKVHASCRHTHSAVDAALALRARHYLAPDDIESVQVRIYSQGLALLDGVEPVTPYAAKFSLPFCVAVALIHGDLAPDRFTEDSILDERTLALAGRISFAPDPALDALYPREWPSVVTIRTRAGATLSERTDHPAGDPEAPLTNDALTAKFVALLGSSRGDSTAFAADILERTPPLSASELVRACNGPTAPLEARSFVGMGSR